MMKEQGAIGQIMQLVRADSRYAGCVPIAMPLHNIRCMKMAAKRSPVKAMVVFGLNKGDISFDDALEAALITERKALHELAKK